MEKNRFEKLLNSSYSPLLLFLGSFAFVTLFSRSTSFLYAFEGADPSIFKQMGRAVVKGKLLYIDYFDNKGCLLYFIHALGLWLGGNTALLLMQSVSLTVTLVLWNKTLALYRSAKQRVLFLFIALFMLLCFYGSGDQSQEWCLPFISYPLLIFCRARKENTTVRPLQMLGIGLCFGVITFIQINNACAFLGFIACLWIQYLREKDFRKLFSSLGCFILGWLFIAIPCVSYFYVKAGWPGVDEMFYASFLSNFEYLGAQQTIYWHHVLPYSIFILSLLAINWFGLRKQQNLLVPVILSLLLFAVTYGRWCNAFYLIALIPLCIVSMMGIDFKAWRRTMLVLAVFSLACVALMGSVVVFQVVNDLILRKDKETVIYDRFHHCLENVPMDERDSIYNFNLFWHGTNMMEHEGLLQCNRVLFTTSLFRLPRLIKEETSKKNGPPKWMILSFDKKYDENDMRFILENYELVCSFVYDKQYLKKLNFGKKFEVCLYRRADRVSMP